MRPAVSPGQVWQCSAEVECPGFTWRVDARAQYERCGVRFASCNDGHDELEIGADGAPACPNCIMVSG